MNFSLFGEKHPHHIVAEQDVEKELFLLLTEAKELYQRDVVFGEKRYARYVEDFVNSHRYIDCNRTVCNNCHEMNLHIVKGLLTDCNNLVKQFFESDTFSFEECMRLKRMYDTSNLSQPSDWNGTGSHFNVPLSFGCSFTKEQMEGITVCADTYHLFCVPSLKVEDMETLFACKEGFYIRVNNVRYVAVLFDALLENKLIRSYWQSVLEKGKFLLRKNGRGFVSASSLSSALSAARANMTSVSKGIRKEINELKR